LTDEDRGKNRTKSKVRAKVEVAVFKRVFGFSKVRYRGLDKNANRVFVVCGLINLYMARKLLLRPT
jgi:transposase, IS5 family